LTRINKLVLHGFKSFAKRTEIVFDSNYNVIIGPNGAGKSNIGDALCFVLGRASTKSLRAEKLTSFIYNGGKTKKPADKAEVSIFFDNSTKIFPSNEPEIKISRIAKQNGQSIYKINEKTVTRQQVLELMSLAKIDPDGYNIVLQGDIIKFVEMSTEERRRLIEEISGISIYEDKKQKAVNELDKVEQKLREADIILTERETYLKELKNERDQALKYNETSEAIKRNKATLVHKKIIQKGEEKKRYEEKIDEIKQKIDETNKEIYELKKDIESKKAEIAKINNEIEQKGEKEQVALHKEIEKLRIDLATSKNKIESYKNEITRVKSRKEQLNQNINDIEEKIKRLNQEKKQILSDIETNEKSIRDIENKISNFKKNNKLDNIGDFEKEIDSLDRLAEDKQKEIQNLRQEQQELLRNKDKLDMQIQVIDDKIEKVFMLEKENREQIDLLKKHKEDFKKLTLELNTLLNEDSSLSAQLANARSKLKSAEEELSRLNARNISIREATLGDIALSKILEQKNKIKGIYGTVSELGEVSSNYALALEVAAGHKLRGVVVEDDAVASQCINFLKQNKLGTATFFPLNKIKPKEKNSEIEQLKKSAGCIGLAIDLIHYDPKFKNVFSYVFENILIVDNIETARKIGIGKAKMVTIDGDVSELSGAMQGGYKEKRKLGLGFQEKELKDSISKQEHILEETTALINAIESKKASLEGRIYQLREQKANIEGEIIKLEKSLHLESGDIDLSKKEKENLKKEIENIEKEMQKIESKISNINNEFTKIKTKKQEIKDRITELRNPALIAELSAFEEKKKQLMEKSIQYSGDLKSIDTQLNTILIPEKDNILKIIKQHDKENENFNEEIKNLTESIKNFESELKDKEKKERIFMEQFKDLFTTKNKIEEKIEKLEFRIGELNESIKKNELKMNSLSLEHARVTAEFAAANKEFEIYAGVEIYQRKSEEQILKDITELEQQILTIGNVNMRALEIYENVEKEYQELLNKKDKLKLEKEDVLIMMNEIELKKKDLFMKTFEVINDKFKTTFSQLSNKGDASLVVENKEDPFAAGVMIKVRLTGDKYLDIRSLSGGEKTLTALAFIFAIQEHDPAFFYILDEVDAALDKRNSDLLSKLIRKYSEKAQYIVVSHNDELISEADTLYGVSMDEFGISKVTSLRI